MKQRIKQIKGFTLIELMVVVAIIAILSVIGLAIFSTAQANARDARRKGDIDAIANVLETSRSPGTVFYTSLPAASFSGGKVPKDTYTTERYCIMSVVDVDTKISDPTAWGAVVCPTAATTTPTAGKTITYTEIPDTGIASTVAPFGAAGPLVVSNNVTAWKVCAKLESGSYYCKPSAQ